MSLLNIPYMNIVLLKCYSSFRVRLYSKEKEERLHLFYCKSIFHMVFFACHVMVEIASCGSSALYCFNICMWEGKIMLSDLCCLLFTMFLALPVLWKKGRKWYEWIIREDKDPVGPSADNPCKLTLSKARDRETEESHKGLEQRKGEGNYQKREGRASRHFVPLG